MLAGGGMHSSRDSDFGGEWGYPAEAATPWSNLAVLKDYRTERVASANRQNNDDFLVVKPREVFNLATLDGPGEVTHLWVTIATPNSKHLRDLVLRVYYDGNSFPSVESPIGDFFGLGHAKYYNFQNFAQAIGTNKGMNSFWPMPFEKSARLEVANESDQPIERFYYYVDWRKLHKMPRGAGYFHAQYRQAFPCPDREPYLILDTEGGRGQYMGVNLSIHTQVDDWWGEGDDIMLIDGEASPSLWGTGSEDYFCGAWGFGNEFANLNFGMPLRTKMDQSPNNFWNVYRYHFENPVVFSRSIKVWIEHGADGASNTRRGGRNNDYASVAYWYMDKPVALKGNMPPAPERISRLRSVELPEGAIEAHLCKIAVSDSENIDAGEQDMSEFVKDGNDWLDGNQLFVRGETKNSVTTLTWIQNKPVEGAAVLRMTRAKDYGIVEIALDGDVIVRQFDGYAEAVSGALIPLGERKLAEGPHRLTIRVTGKNHLSENLFWGMDYLRVGGQAPAVESATPIVNLDAPR